MGEEKMQRSLNAEKDKKNGYRVSTHDVFYVCIVFYYVLCSGLCLFWVLFGLQVKFPPGNNLVERCML